MYQGDTAHNLSFETVSPSGRPALGSGRYLRVELELMGIDDALEL